MGTATELSFWDSYLLNVLYCPALAMPEPMPLSEATHIYALSTSVLYFSSNKIGVKIQSYWSSEDPAYAWFYAPWNEAIVEVFPSRSDSTKIFVQTATSLYSINRYTIDPTLVWTNLPSANVTIVELSDGRIVLFSPDANTGYISIYYKSNINF